MENNKGIEAVYAETRHQWRQWLIENSQLKKVVCLIIHHKKGITKSVNYTESIEEALCYGWIDSKANKRDGESYYLQFTPRKPKSNWSKPNVERVRRMIAEGLMTEYGQKFIDIAKQTGKWPEESENGEGRTEKGANTK